MSNNIDNRRSSAIYMPSPNDPMIHMIGVGATGSHMWDMLTCLGYPHMVAYDFDTVEEHNLNNQTYTKKHVGMLKVEALKKQTEEKCDNDYLYYNHKVTPGTLNHSFQKYYPTEGHVVVLAIDTMAGRKELGKAVYGEHLVDFVVDPRIASKHADVYAFPNSAWLEWEKWWETIRDDDDPIFETSPCGGSISVKPTITMCASLCVWSILDWVNERAFDYGISSFVSPPSLGYKNETNNTATLCTRPEEGKPTYNSLFHSHNRHGVN